MIGVGLIAILAGVLIAPIQLAHAANCASMRQIGNDVVPRADVTDGNMTYIDSDARSGNILPAGDVHAFRFYAMRSGAVIHLQLFSEPKQGFFSLLRSVPYKIERTGEHVVAVRPAQRVSAGARYGFTTLADNGVLAFTHTRSFFAFRGYIAPPYTEGLHYRTHGMVQWRVSLAVDMCEFQFVEMTDNPSPTTHALQTPTQTPIYISGGWRYEACALDREERDLEHLAESDAEMTPTRCGQLCTDSKYMAVQNGRACFCGPRYGRYGPLPARYCRLTPCGAEPGLPCGGPWVNAIYKRL